MLNNRAFTSFQKHTMKQESMEIWIVTIHMKCFILKNLK